MRLKSKLLSLNVDKPIPAKIFSPANCEELRIPFKTDKIAKVVGKLAQASPHPLSIRPRTTIDEDGDEVEEVERSDTPNGVTQSNQPTLIAGVLVQNDFKMSLMAPEDLREYAGLNTTTITCRQRLTLGAAGASLIRWALEGTFGSVKETSDKPVKQNGNTVNGDAVKSEDLNGDVDMDGIPSETVFEVMDCVKVKCAPEGAVEVEWEGNMVNDSIADAVLAALLTVESSPAAVKRTCSQCPEKIVGYELIFHQNRRNNIHMDMPPSITLMLSQIPLPASTVSVSS